MRAPSFSGGIVGKAAIAGLAHRPELVFGVLCGSIETLLWRLGSGDD